MTTITLPSTNVNKDDDFYAIYNAKSDGVYFRQRVNISSYDILPGGISILEGYRNSANYGWLRLSSYGLPYGGVFNKVKTNGTWGDWYTFVVERNVISQG